MTTDFERQVCEDWQSGRLRWPDAVASLGLAGLPSLYVLAYRRGVEIRRRFADEARLPDLARRSDLTPEIWRANPAWRAAWFRDIADRWQLDPGQPYRQVDALENGSHGISLAVSRAAYEKRWIEQMATDGEAEAEERRRRIRRIRHRVTWLEATFDPIPDDPCRAVVELWASGGTSTAMAMEILDVDEDRLRRLADDLGVETTRGDT